MDNKKLVKNPNYVPGSGLAEYMPADMVNEQGLEEPVVDPISLTAGALTAGMSGGLGGLGSMAKEAAKSTAGKSLLDAIKQAAAERSKRIASTMGGGNTIEEPVAQMGGAPVFGNTNASADYLKSLMKSGKFGGG